MTVVILVELSVDPAVAQGGVDRLGLADGDLPGSLLGELDPHACRVGSLISQKCFQALGVGERNDRQTGSLLHQNGSLLRRGGATRKVAWTRSPGAALTVLRTAVFSGRR